MPGLEAVYNRHGYSVEKRNALALWADHVHALVEKRDRTRVLPRSKHTKGPGPRLLPALLRSGETRKRGRKPACRLAGLSASG